ncbi:MAG TPA: ABC transporter ATP-binding protein [Deltaproteobacteria bacterium]|nr:ABC transporter ATP-binding protein [Deltaproteobacteria bacterium]
MIEVERVTKAFGRTRVLDGLSITIPSRQRVALVGANGAGKTTLIRCLLGQYGFEGRISIDGMSPRSDRRAILKRTGFVPQLPPPLRLTVGQLIQFAASLCDAEPGRMVEVAKRLGLDADALRNHSFSKLSGGQKQKLLIAVALGRDTSLLIMDEPAANLDPDARRIFFELLGERSQHATMLISSHRLDEVAQLVQRVVELDHGRICLDDHVADSGALDAILWCHLELSRSEESAARILAEWGFTTRAEGLCFEGSVPGPDRLRFLGALARYSGLIRNLRLEAEGQPDA